MKKIIKGIKLFTDHITFLVSTAFAVYVILTAVSNGGWVFIGLGTPLIVINFLIFRKDFSLSRSVIFSTALVIFMLHFFNSFAEEIWIKSLKFLPLIIESFGIQIVSFLLLGTIGFLFILVIPFYTIFILIKKESIIRKFIESNICIKYFSIPLVFAYFFGFFYLFPLIDIPLNDESTKFVAKVITFIVGFIPAYWFYGLFIKPIYKKRIPLFIEGGSQRS